MNITELKSLIKNVIDKKGEVTIQEICKELNYEDDFKIAAAVARLENEGTIISSGEAVVYREDGDAILLGKYRIMTGSKINKEKLMGNQE